MRTIEIKLFIIINRTTERFKEGNIKSLFLIPNLRGKIMTRTCVYTQTFAPTRF